MSEFCSGLPAAYVQVESIWAFGKEVFWLALNSAIAAMSTSKLALVAAISYYIYRLILTLIANGVAGVRRHLLHAFLFALCWWVVLVAVHFVYVIPHEIEMQAESVVMPPIQRLSPPYNWSDKTPTPVEKIESQLLSVQGALSPRHVSRKAKQQIVAIFSAYGGRHITFSHAQLDNDFVSAFNWMGYSIKIDRDRQMVPLGGNTYEVVIGRPILGASE